MKYCHVLAAYRNVTNVWKGDNRMQKAEREIRDKTSGGKEQESLTRRK